MPIQLPIGKEGDFRGIIDLVEMKAYIYHDPQVTGIISTAQVAWRMALRMRSLGMS